MLRHRIPPRQLQPLLAGLLLVGAVGCGGPANSLGGSIGESFSLLFDRVVIYKQGLDLRIEYLKDLAGTTNKVTKVIVDTEGMNIKSETVIEKAAFKRVVTIERVANTGGNFPDVDEGKVTFNVFKFRDGGQIDGDFEAAFVNGRTLNGNFDAQVAEIPLD